MILTHMAAELEEKLVRSEEGLNNIKVNIINAKT